MNPGYDIKRIQVHSLLFCFILKVHFKENERKAKKIDDTRLILVNVSVKMVEYFII